MEIINICHCERNEVKCGNLYGSIQMRDCHVVPPRNDKSILEKLFSHDFLEALQ